MKTLKDEELKKVNGGVTFVEENGVKYYSINKDEDLAESSIIHYVVKQSFTHVVGDTFVLVEKLKSATKLEETEKKISYLASLKPYNKSFV